MKAYKRQKRQMTNLRRAALDYHEQNFSVIPIRRKGKQPWLKEWGPFQKTLASAKQIGKWWDEHASANIGIVTGTVSGLVVVDADHKKAKGELQAFKQEDKDFLNTEPCAQA